MPTASRLKQMLPLPTGSTRRGFVSIQRSFWSYSSRLPLRGSGHRKRMSPSTANRSERISSLFGSPHRLRSTSRHRGLTRSIRFGALSAQLHRTPLRCSPGSIRQRSFCWFCRSHCSRTFPHIQSSLNLHWFDTRALPGPAFATTSWRSRPAMERGLSSGLAQHRPRSKRIPNRIASRFSGFQRRPSSHSGGRIHRTSFNQASARDVFSDCTDRCPAVEEHHQHRYHDPGDQSIGDGDNQI